MEFIGIATLVVAVITLVFSISQSKAYVQRRIERKEEMIRRLDTRLVQKYGLNGRGPHALSSEELKISSLRQDIEKLRRRI